MSDAHDDRLNHLLHEATQEMVRSIDAMPDAQWSEPSLLPGWTRAHVVAHLVLNAEGLAGALTGIDQGQPTPMYSSQEARGRDIDELATATPSALRSRLLASVTHVAEAITAVPDEIRDAPIERVPGGTRFAAGAVPSMRLREVEIHHVDLALAHTPADWSDEFAVHLVDTMVKRRPQGHAFDVYATDVDRTWTCGDRAGGARVSGTAADLGWWLSGRRDRARLTSDDGELPGIEAW